MGSPRVQVARVLIQVNARVASERDKRRNVVAIPAIAIELAGCPCVGCR